MQHCAWSCFACPTDVEPDPNNTRLGSTAPRPGKPTVVLTKSFHLWLCDASADDLQLEAGELFGFGTGAYSEKVLSRLAISGLMTLHHGYPFQTNHLVLCDILCIFVLSHII